MNMENYSLQTETPQSDGELGLPTPSCYGSLDLHLADCMDLMAKYPDGHFDLAIVDPPYGIGMGGGLDIAPVNKVIQKNGKALAVKSVKYAKKQWDTTPPPPEYFAELRRVSRNQIVWGANHFIERLPINSPS